MEQTVQITPEQREALKSAFPDMTADEAASVLVSAELSRRYRLHIKRAAVVRLQALKRLPA